MSNKSYRPAVGLDIGTMNLVSARRTDTNKIETVRVRDAFIELDMEAKKTLRMSSIDFVELGGRLLVIGDSAMNLVNLFKKELRRPLSRGVIAAGELDAQQVLSVLVKHVLGAQPITPGEHCFYSVPAAPIDEPEQDILYHTEVFRKILTEHGYRPHAMNEAMAIIFGQCSKEKFSGISVSLGSGMVNVALAYQTVSGLEFALSRGGDWIDTHAAKALGSTSARMCALKEKGIDLTSTNKTREEEALSLYIRSLIKYCLDNIAIQFRKVQSVLSLPEPIPFVISGGTSLAGGFLDVFKQEFDEIQKKGFPIQISEIRPATDPLTAVAEGLLVLAAEEE